MPDKTILSAKNLDFFYGSSQALRHITVNIPSNQVTAFIGPSGCGKSTFLRTINRMNDLIPIARVTGSLSFHGRGGDAPPRDVTPPPPPKGRGVQKPQHQTNRGILRQPIT